MDITILGPNLPDQSEGSYHVHAAGCANVKPSKYSAVIIRNAPVFAAASKAEAVEWAYEDFLPGGCAEGESEVPYTVADLIGDFKFFPCCTGTGGLTEIDPLAKILAVEEVELPSEVDLLKAQLVAATAKFQAAAQALAAALIEKGQ